MRNWSESLLFSILLLLLLINSLYLARTRMESYQLGYRVGQLMKEKQKLTEETRRLIAEKTSLHSYSNLLKQNEELQINLVSPEKWLELAKNKRK